MHVCAEVCIEAEGWPQIFALPPGYCFLDSVINSSPSWQRATPLVQQLVYGVPFRQPPNAKRARLIKAVQEPRRNGSRFRRQDCRPTAARATAEPRAIHLQLP